MEKIRRAGYVRFAHVSRKHIKIISNDSFLRAYLDEYRSDRGTPPSSSASLILISPTCLRVPNFNQESHRDASCCRSSFSLEDTACSIALDRCLFLGIVICCWPTFFLLLLSCTLLLVTPLLLKALEVTAKTGG